LALDISPQAVEKARELFPQLPVQQGALAADLGPVDALMFNDVLEHVENPHELLRTAAVVATHMIVRQPLLESFAMFRHNGYRNQREGWGHIALFNVRSFTDMALAAGWEPLELRLVAPWELVGATQRGRWTARMMVKANREIASQFITGFYLNGAFRRSRRAGHS
jgi:hypothetical protein